MENSKEFSEICIKCKKCCESIAVCSINPYNDEVKEFYEARGAKVTPKVIGPNMIVAFIEFNLPCPHLHYHNGCNIYDTRPKVCREYPVDGNQILEKCELHKRGLI